MLSLMHIITIKYVLEMSREYNVIVNRVEIMNSWLKVLKWSKLQITLIMFRKHYRLSAFENILSKMTRV